jgi:hypothetical protein
LSILNDNRQSNAECLNLFESLYNSTLSCDFFEINFYLIMMTKKCLVKSKNVTELKLINISVPNFDLKNVKSTTLYYRNAYQYVSFNRVDHLIVGSYFNMVPLDFANVTQLTCEFYFNDSMNNKSFDLQNITKLVFKSNCIFNKSLDNLDLKNVFTLKLGGWFNRSIDYLDLKHVRTLVLGGRFNSSMGWLNVSPRQSFLTFFKSNFSIGWSNFAPK